MAGRKSLLFAAIASMALLAACSLVQRKAPPSFAERIQGKWVGHPPDDPSQTIEWTIAGDKLIAKGESGDTYKGTIKINEAVSPVQIDLHLTDCADPSLNGETVLGIAKLENDKLTFCLGDPSYGNRPKKFDPYEGMMITGERAK